MKKSLKSLGALIHALKTDELEPGQAEAADRAIKAVMRGLQGGNIHQVRAALDALAHVFVRAKKQRSR